MHTLPVRIPDRGVTKISMPSDSVPDVDFRTPGIWLLAPLVVAVMAVGMAALARPGAPPVSNWVAERVASRWIAGDYRGMERAVNAYIHLSPRDPEGYRLLGMKHYFQAQQQSDEPARARHEKLRAAEAFEAALARDPSAIEPLFNLAVVQRDLGLSYGEHQQVQAALRSFKRVLERPDDERGDLQIKAMTLLGSLSDEGTMNLRPVLEDANRRFLALGDIQALLKRDPDDPRLLAHLAEGEAKAGERAAASRLLLRAWAHSGDESIRARYLAADDVR